MGRGKPAPTWLRLIFKDHQRRARIKSRSAARESNLEIPDKRSIDAIITARPALRRADVIEEPRLHRNRRPDAGARHRREHGDLFSHRSDPPSASARGKAGGFGRAAFTR